MQLNCRHLNSTCFVFLICHWAPYRSWHDCCSLFSHLVVPNSLWTHAQKHARLPCPSLSPGVCLNSCPSNWWCLPTVTSSVPFSVCLHSFPASGSFPMSWFFASGGPSIGASASALVLPMNIQGWFPLRLTGLISLLFKGLSRVLSSTTIQKHQFYGAQPSLWFHSHICSSSSLVAKSCLTLATPWTIALQVPRSVGFSRQECWSGLPCPPPGDLPDTGIEPVSPATPALQADSLPLSCGGSPTSTMLLLLSRFSRVRLCATP